MAIPQNDKHKEYVRYASCCLDTVITTRDPEVRAIQREMAVEWLKLADIVIHPLGPSESK
jgi:hypothetical protein